MRPLARRLLLPRPTLRGVWLGMLLLYSAACIILPIIWKGAQQAVPWAAWAWAIATESPQLAACNVPTVVSGLP